MKTFIIAEGGVNHNGDLRLAYKIIDAAKFAGADAIKFQAYITDEICIKNSKLAKYQKKTKFNSQYDLLKKYELKTSQILKLAKYAQKKKINFLLSFFDTKSLELATRLNLKYIKIPSGEINNFLLLKKAAKLKKKIIFSTGMASKAEIFKTKKYLNKNGLSDKKIIILYCVSSYPTKFEEIYLPEIKFYKKKYKVRVGFSDHSMGIEASMASILFGATVIEKHLTLNRNLSGPDHQSSIEPNEFKDMVDGIRNIEKMCVKSKHNDQLDNKTIVRKSIFAKKNIKKGEIFSEENITTKRPENKLSEKNIFKVLGKKSKKNFQTNDPIVI